MLERLTEKDREFIKNQVMAGYYVSEIEVVRDAIRRLREKVQDEKLYHLRAMALVGHEQLQQGKGEILTAKKMDALLVQAKKDYQNRKPAKDDVRG